MRTPRFPGGASRLAALLPRSHAACMLPRCALPARRRATETDLVASQHPASTNGVRRSAPNGATVVGGERRQPVAGVGWVETRRRPERAGPTIRAPSPPATPQPAPASRCRVRRVVPRRVSQRGPPWGDAGRRPACWCRSAQAVDARSGASARPAHHDARSGRGPGPLLAAPWCGSGSTGAHARTAPTRRPRPALRRAPYVRHTEASCLS